MKLTFVKNIHKIVEDNNLLSLLKAEIRYFKTKNNIDKDNLLKDFYSKTIDTQSIWIDIVSDIENEYSNNIEEGLNDVLLYSKTVKIT